MKSGRSGAHKPAKIGLTNKYSDGMAVRMVVSPLWRGPGNIHGFVLNGKSYLLLKHQL